MIPKIIKDATKYMIKRCNKCINSEYKCTECQWNILTAGDIHSTSPYRGMCFALTFMEFYSQHKKEIDNDTR